VSLAIFRSSALPVNQEYVWADDSNDAAFSATEDPAPVHMKHLTCDERSAFGGKIANSLGDVLRSAWPAHWSLVDRPLATLIRHAVAEKLRAQDHAGGYCVDCHAVGSEVLSE